MKKLFYKYQALGNAYIVLASEKHADHEFSAIAQHLSNYRLGIGSDGVLWGPFQSGIADFRLRIFNPDGSEAEKSGNGLRIFCQYLYDQGLASAAPFTVETKGGVVKAQVFPKRQEVQVAMGHVSFNSTLIPVAGPEREVLCEALEVNGHKLNISCATIGNPHCVVFVDNPTEELARKLGPLLENHEIFPNRTNVQFVSVINPNNIRMEIWERGAGYTYASGSSSCAATAVAFKHGLVESEVMVRMRGGTIMINISDAFEVTMIGAVEKICEGQVNI